MRLELTCVGLLVELANHYSTRGAFCEWNVTHVHGKKHIYKLRMDKNATYLLLGE